MPASPQHFFSDSLKRIFYRTQHENKFLEIARYLEEKFNYCAYGSPDDSNRYRLSIDSIQEHMSIIRQLQTSELMNSTNLNELGLEELVFLLAKALPQGASYLFMQEPYHLLRFYGSFLIYILIEELRPELNFNNIPWNSR